MRPGVGVDEELHTRRLLLRRFRASDGPALHDYLSRPEAVRFEPYPVQGADDCALLASQRAADADADATRSVLSRAELEPEWPPKLILPMNA